MTKIVDLSHLIVSDPPDLPDFLRSEVSYQDHANGAREFEQGFGTDRSLLLRGEGPAGERLSIGTHSVTHLDAPYHYNSTIQGRPSETIDELPLEWFFAPGRGGRRDSTARTATPSPPSRCSAGIEAAGHELKSLDIVLVHTGTDRYYGQRDYMHHGPGVTPEATRWLWEQGVRVMGIDAWGWDAPLRHAGRGRARAKRAGHHVGRASGRPALLADRAPHQPRGPAQDRLHGRLLPAEDLTGECRSGAGRRDPRLGGNRSRAPRVARARLRRRALLRRRGPAGQYTLCARRHPRERLGQPREVCRRIEVGADHPGGARIVLDQQSGGGLTSRSARRRRDRSMLVLAPPP